MTKGLCADSPRTVISASPYCICGDLVWSRGVTIVFNVGQNAFTIRLPAARHALARLCYIARRLSCRGCVIRAQLSQDLGRLCVLVRRRAGLSVHWTFKAGRTPESSARRLPALSLSCLKSNSVLMDSQSGSPSGTYAVASGQANWQKLATANNLSPFLPC